MSGPKPATPPEPVVLEGRYVRLEPLSVKHAADLFEASNVPDAEARFAYLPDHAPRTQADTEAFIDNVVGKVDPMPFAVIDKATGKAGGRQALMRIVPEHGVIEIGSIYWGPSIARTRLATEALYLFARHIFEDLGYRRFEWKCNNRNEPSKRAALRFGFTHEGVFRQHMIVKGESRDTAWFSMLDAEWPARKAGFERWLAPENFDAKGRQLAPLTVR
ncbi:MAG: family acetyltransferase [Devosia sp.]|uniref:GNAT family N-acetyltransferase n=1 Tax=Devosia sp. TaxID=1871048 RepID=UPI00262A221C|nr:GNAT family protein [Devosia sp.]MDB5538727.1 family acetyltransferase [Devosia sp.]